MAGLALEDQVDQRWSKTTKAASKELKHTETMFQFLSSEPINPGLLPKQAETVPQNRDVGSDPDPSMSGYGPPRVCEGPFRASGRNQWLLRRGRD